MIKIDMDYEREQFAKRLNKLLELRGHGKKTLVELKHLLELSTPLLCNLRNGNALPSIFSGKLLCSKLDVSFEWLLTGSGAMQGFDMKNPDEVGLILRYRSLTPKGKRKLIMAAFNEECSNHELEPLKHVVRRDEKQTLLKLVSKGEG